MQKELVSNRLKEMKVHPDSKQCKSLYQHLSLLLPQLSSFQKDKIPPISNFQYISQYLKKFQHSPKSPMSEEQLQKFINHNIHYPQWLKIEENLKNTTFKETNDRIISNFQLQSDKLFAKVGLGFGKEESVRIYSALKKIAQTKKATKLRFWGKILTRNGDYLIIQGFTNHSNAGEAIGDVQKIKQGANYNTYWVSHSTLSQEWNELPLVTPTQLKVSRLIKYTFTGKLQNPIKSSPPFNGQEKHLLKAQIVRITHNCQIAPKGLYSPLEDNPDQIDYSQQFKMPDFAELGNLENWIHINPYLLKMGRGSYYVDPKSTEEEKQALLAKLAETDPKIERLKAINEDKGLQKFGLEGCWTSKVYGSTQLFNNVGKQQGSTSCYAVVALRNPHWPGWTTVASGKQFGSIYIGYGLKSSQPAFHPLGPEDISIQADDVEQIHEPNPKDPPDELQSDSDDQKKKLEE